VCEALPRRSRKAFQAERASQCGTFLIEALVALLVVSIASAGLFALMGNLLRASTDALLRAEATELAAATLARMATDSPATLADRYDASTGGSGFVALASAAQRLPGVTAVKNLPSVNVAPGPSAGTRRVSVTVRWQAPNDPSARVASMATVVGP
jgi:Tfp pilus assembly protein PilV